ncbi:hypothetical protein CHUAL_005585 [Chamberlinius hualienensis]
MLLIEEMNWKKKLEKEASFVKKMGTDKSTFQLGLQGFSCNATVGMVSAPSAKQESCVMGIGTKCEKPSLELEYKAEICLV